MTGEERGLENPPSSAKMVIEFGGKHDLSGVERSFPQSIDHKLAIVRLHTQHRIICAY